MDPNIRRILVAAFLVATAAASGVVLFAYSSKRAISDGQQCSGAFCWGYRLDQARFVPKTTLSIWSSSGLNVKYRLPAGAIVPLDQDRWLANGRAIYLNFRLQTTPNSKELGDHVRIVYDYDRGTLHVASPLPLWRNGDPHSSDSLHNWLSDDALDAVLIQIDPTG